MYKPRKFVDIVIPFNNEYKNLQILIPRILKTIKKIKYLKFRVVFVDDGSIDNGHIIINKFKKKYKHIFLLRNKKNFGQTYCYMKYLKNFRIKYFIRMDADNQDNPKYLLQMSKFILEGYDLILTERKLRKHYLYMIILTFCFNKLIALLVKKKLKNYSSSMVCFKKKFISKGNLKHNDHRYLPIIAIDNGVKKIKTFPVIHEKRKFGFSKYKMFKKVFLALPEFLYFFLRLKVGSFKI